MRMIWHRWRIKYLKALLKGAIDTRLRGKILDNIQYHSNKNKQA